MKKLGQQLAPARRGIIKWDPFAGGNQPMQKCRLFWAKMTPGLGGGELQSPRNNGKLPILQCLTVQLGPRLVDISPRGMSNPNPLHHFHSWIIIVGIRVIFWDWRIDVSKVFVFVGGPLLLIVSGRGQNM